MNMMNNNGLISFDDFMRNLILSDFNVDRKKFWKFCCQDLRSKKTGDIYWHGSELNNEFENVGYFEDWNGIFEDYMRQRKESVRKVIPVCLTKLRKEYKSL